MKKFTFLKALFSPFKPFAVKFYFGKTAIGLPYFLPRKWVKGTPELAHKATLEYIEREKNFNKMNPKSARKIRPYEEVYQEKLRYDFPIPKKIGFDFLGLGWKTKWSDTDYRFEWAPVWSFVFFGYQIALIFVAPEQHHYWEAWLYYEMDTNKSHSPEVRIQTTMHEFPLNCTVYTKGTEEKVNYYNHILKNKYKKHIA